MNHTYYNKLKKIYNKSNDELTKEIFRVSDIGVNSEWGFTDAMKEYIKYLKIIKNLNRLKLKFLIKPLLKKIKRKLKNKIRVLFLVNEYSTFPSVMSVYETMDQDKDIICDLVHIPFNHSNKTTNTNKEINDYIKNGYDKIIEGEEYDLCKSSPDIVIYLKPYDTIPTKFYIDEMQRVVEKMIYIPYGIHMIYEKEMNRYAFQLPMHERVWYYVSHSKRNTELGVELCPTKGKNFLTIGHPRMDLIHKDFTEDRFYKKIKKQAKGRKIFLYDPHHSISDGLEWGTFKLYGLDILRYFKKHKDVFLLYRPHPLLKGALEKEYKGDKKFFKEYESLLKSENIIYDDTSNYLVAMHISDYLISDTNSFVPEFTMYNKPVIHIIYKNHKMVNDKELESMIYSVNTLDGIIKKIDYLKNGNDELKEIRTKLRKSFFNYDENITVAQKLINTIKKEFYK